MWRGLDADHDACAEAVQGRAKGGALTGTRSGLVMAVASDVGAWVLCSAWGRMLNLMGVSVMDGTIRIRSLAWFATGAVLALVCTLLVAQPWSADAAPGDDDATLFPVTPCRLFDFRPGQDPAGGKKTPLGAGEGAVHTQQVTGTVGDCTIPADASAVAMNVTIVNPTAQSNLRVYPADAALPTASNLNWLPGQSATPNKVDVKLSADGTIKLFNQNGTVNVLADVVGYYSGSTLTELAATAGVAGPQGPVGPAGPKGDTGAQGDQGEQGVPGPRGDQGEQGVPGPRGDQGEQGVPGPRGFSAWDVVPPGVTIAGYVNWNDGQTVADNDPIYNSVAFPAVLPSPPVAVNFAPDSAPETIDDDAACTGTAEAPTAPAGRVCVYLRYLRSFDNIAATNIDVSGGGPFGDTHAFAVSMQTTGVGESPYIAFSWAYTAP